jgi:hypothetical protein
VTGPEHLREGKRLLSECVTIGEATPAAQAMATVASAHLAAAQVIAYAAAHLPDHTSWQKAGDA